VQVIVPPGALTANTDIAISDSDVGAPTLPAGIDSVGQVFALTPHGTTFATPVTVVIPYRPGALPPGIQPAIFKTNAARNAWGQLPAQDTTVGLTEIRVQVSSFSWVVSGVLPPPITAEPSPARVTEGQSAQFEVTAVSAAIDPAGLAYQWQRSGDDGATFEDIEGATSRTFLIDGALADNGAQFRVRVSDRGGVVMSDPATLTVDPIVCTIDAAVITVQPQNMVARVSTPVTFSVTATGTNLQYQWLRSDGPGQPFQEIAGATSASFTLLSAQSSDNADRFFVRVSNTGNTVDSNAVTLTVEVPTFTGPRVGGGASFSVARLADSRLVSWGSEGTFGLLGNGPGASARTTPGDVDAVSGVVSLGIGPAHSLAVLANGEVWGWGFNVDGQIGGATGAVETPRPVPGVTNATAACGGGSLSGAHSLFLLSNRTVVGLGANASGQLGNGSSTPAQGTPVQVSGLQNVRAIACGIDYSMALLDNGTVFAWGNNNAGQLGNGTTTSSNVPVQVIGLTNVTAIAAGENHSLAISGGAVWAWGQNAVGELGDGTTTLRRTSPVLTQASGVYTGIAANGSTSMALRSDNLVFVWGTNESAQLANGTITGFSATPVQIPNLTGVTEIAIGRQPGVAAHLLAVRSDGSVWAWGLNDLGQIGSGEQLIRMPIQISGLTIN